MNARRKTYTPTTLALVGLVVGIGVACALIAFGAAAVTSGLARGHTDSIMIGVFLTAFGGLIVYAAGYTLVWKAHTVNVEPDGTLEFVSLTSRNRLHVGELVLVREEGTATESRGSSSAITAARFHPGW
jgi:hypothetical protein